MSTDPSPKADPWDVFQSWLVPARVVVHCHVSNCALVRPRAEQSVVCADVGLGNMQPRPRSGTSSLCDVCLANGPACLRASAYSTASLGVGIFGWLLDVSGWNRQIKPLRGFSVQQEPAYHPWNRVRAPAPSPMESALPSTYYWPSSHLFSRHPWSAALWMLLPGVVVHLYPVLLQRSMMLRLQPLLDKSGS